MELLDGLVGARDIREGDLRALFRDELGLRLAELHDAVAAALHARQHEPEDQADQQQRDQDRQQADEPVRLRHLVVELGVARGDGGDDLGRALRDVVELHVRAEVLDRRC